MTVVALIEKKARFLASFDVDDEVVPVFGDLNFGGAGGAEDQARAVVAMRISGSQVHGVDCPFGPQPLRKRRSVPECRGSSAVGFYYGCRAVLVYHESGEPVALAINEPKSGCLGRNDCGAERSRFAKPLVHRVVGEGGAFHGENTKRYM